MLKVDADVLHTVTASEEGRAPDIPRLQMLMERTIRPILGIIVTVSRTNELYARTSEVVVHVRAKFAQAHHRY